MVSQHAPAKAPVHLPLADAEEVLRMAAEARLEGAAFFAGLQAAGFFGVDEGF